MRSPLEVAISFQDSVVEDTDGAVVYRAVARDELGVDVLLGNDLVRGAWQRLPLDSGGHGNVRRLQHGREDVDELHRLVHRTTGAVRSGQLHHHRYVQQALVHHLPSVLELSCSPRSSPWSAVTTMTAFS